MNDDHLHRRRMVLGYVLIAMVCAFVAAIASFSLDPAPRAVFVFAFGLMAALEGALAAQRANR